MSNVHENTEYEELAGTSNGFFVRRCLNALLEYFSVEAEATIVQNVCPITSVFAGSFKKLPLSDFAELLNSITYLFEEFVGT